MKKLTTTVFAALIALTLSAPVWAQNTPAPATKSDSKSDSKSDKKGEKKSTKKSKKKDKKADTDTKKASDKK
jgi:hypothetical protein